MIHTRKEDNPETHDEQQAVSSDRSCTVVRQIFPTPPLWQYEYSPADPLQCQLVPVYYILFVTLSPISMAAIMLALH